jgi:hypothetical protein
MDFPRMQINDLLNKIIVRKLITVFSVKRDLSAKILAANPKNKN